MLYNNPFAMGEICPMSLKQTLEKLYKDNSLLLNYSIKAYELANSELFNWDRISNSWDSLFIKSQQRRKAENMFS